MHKFQNVSAIPKPSHVLPTPVQHYLGQWCATATSNPCLPDATAADLVLGQGEVTTKQPRPLEHRCIALASTLALEPAPPSFKESVLMNFLVGQSKLQITYIHFVATFVHIVVAGGGMADKVQRRKRYIDERTDG